MLDHALGRPSANIKRVQILVVVLLIHRFLKGDAAWLTSGNGKAALLARWFNSKFGATQPWKVAVGTLTAGWVAKNLLLLLGWNAPEPLAKMYTKNFYRSSYILTSLDAGFMTAMNIKPKWLRDILSIVFSLFYLCFPDTADEKVRKFRAHPTVDILRVSWNKSLNPYIYLAGAMHRPKLRVRKNITIPRPSPASLSSFPEEMASKPISARLYFAGTERDFVRAKELILMIPGGGFMAMSPICHDDYVSQWAKSLRVPIVSLDYGKAPEFPYPFGLEECFDAYRSIVESNGAVLGMQGHWQTDSSGQRVARAPLKIVVAGDSAGGNLAVGITMRCLETYEMHIPPPNGLILAYPCLSFDMSCWMPSEQVKLMRAESHHNLSLKSLSESKSNMKRNSPLTPQDAPRKIDVFNDEAAKKSRSWYKDVMRPWSSQIKSQGITIPTSLSMTSRISYFTDRIISPEMMRAMALLYLGGSPIPVDLASDYYLSPVMAPDDLLARFPKTYLICGEKDPFVDDTVVFGARLRENKQKARKEWERMMRHMEAEENHGVYGIGGVHNGVNGVNGTKPAPPATSNGTHTNGISTSREANPIRTHIFSRDPDTMIRVKVLEGLSHGILQMLALLPEGRQATRLMADWFNEMFADPGVDDHGEDLTEFMIRDIHRNDGKSDHIPVGPFYPAYGAPQHPPVPHINVARDSTDSMDSVNGHVRFRDDVKSPKPRRGTGSSTTSNPQSAAWEGSSASDLSPTPVMDEVDEKKILERRRTELGSNLYVPEVE